jgi:hypothetical protein
MLHSVEFKKKVFSATPRYAPQGNKIFHVYSVCIIAQSHLYLQIYQRIRNRMQQLFNLLISDRSGLVEKKKPRVGNLVRQSL